MGRVKLKIKRLESISNRQVTYSKRKNGILKKAKELSVLCDIDIILLMFSPTGRPTIFHGERSNVEEILAKFAQLTPQDRAKRKLESLEVLKKTFKKLDHDVNVQDFLCTSTQSIEDLTDQVRMLQSQLAETQRRLRNWSNLDEIDNVEVLSQMEDSITESLHRVRGHKENFEKHQLLLLDCARQNAISLPLMMEGFEEALSFPWLPNNDSQSIMFAKNPNFLHQRDLDFSNDVSAPGFSGYFGTGKQVDISNSGKVDNIGQESSALNDLTRNSCANVPVRDQYSYAPYNVLSLTDNNELKTEIGISPQESCLDYQASTSHELPKQIYDNGYHAWAPITGPGDIVVYDGDSYSQQPN